ncbi:MAG: HAD hydrolase family protein [Verrucomicrobiota bacterium]
MCRERTTPVSDSCSPPTPASPRRPASTSGCPCSTPPTPPSPTRSSGTRTACTRSSCSPSTTSTTRTRSLRLLPPLLGPDLAVSHMGADAVEVAPAGVDKGVGLRWLCAHLGIAGGDVLAFGDEVNDLPMFAFAGRRVAVANASPAVRDAADEVAPSNADDGVAEVIERLLA